MRWKLLEDLESIFEGHLCFHCRACGRSKATLESTFQVQVAAWGLAISPCSLEMARTSCSARSVQHFVVDRLAGGGSSSSDLLAGLQQLCGNYKSQSEDTKDGSESLIMALENLLARGFDLFNGLRRQLAEKEQRSRAQASNSSWSSSWDDKRQRLWKVSYGVWGGGFCEGVG